MKVYSYSIVVKIIFMGYKLIKTGTLTGKRPLGMPRRRWEDIIRIGLKEIVSIRGFRLIRLRIGIIGEPL